MVRDKIEKQLFGYGLAKGFRLHSGITLQFSRESGHG